MAFNPGPKVAAALSELLAAARRVLDDVDDDGVAEAHDVAVDGLRRAVARAEAVMDTAKAEKTNV